ncbi:hypothetical protein IT072_04280 [Leifsonia sp. ZF2019]|uniref:hypothetical protein n=1 Tax=Leifsonia sp. ZF2019 TaxID=2781978 RepID=UPI001CBE1DF9|nr:hypothetical protein [Leifsonia sp. ZF2019]UAJ80273.1 hypothetical protein IT072_04280 [Leifsonia sp. ZF2019]
MSHPFTTVGVPRVVVASFWIWIASAALGLLSFFVGLPALLASPALSAPTGAGIVIGSVGGALIGALLRVFLGLFLLRGANWARIVLTVIGAIVLVALVAAILTGDLIGLLSGIAVVVAAVLMWLPAARAHFRRA